MSQTTLKSPVFLTGEWRKLILANYAVEPALLEKYLPAKTELDFWNGQAYMSLVGFMFLNTKVLGLPAIFHGNFPEVNLRFYVKRKVDGEWRRGVVFIRELVPKPVIALAANVLYGESYSTLPMRHGCEQVDKGQIRLTYEWKTGGGWCKISAKALEHPAPFLPGSEAEYFTEQPRGFAKINQKTTLEYAVEHPPWQVYPVQSVEIQVDGERLYGKGMGAVLKCQPESVLLAEGSEILVRMWRKI